MTSTAPIVLAAVAHPDDIEFMMAGTLLLLRQAGASIHMWNLADGCCGTMRHDRETIVRLRAAEAAASARLIGATWHPPLFEDLAVFYDRPSLAKVAAVVREIKPTVVLTHAPQDYMEDHENACRLLVSAVFARGMPNFESVPARPPYTDPVCLYHAMPHGLADGIGRIAMPDICVDITPVAADKRAMLAMHGSQQSWLDASQGMGAYVDAADAIAHEVAVRFGGGTLVEAWRRHNHLGFTAPGADPLRDLLAGSCHAPSPQ